MRMWQESYDGIGSQMPGVLFEQGEMAILFRRNCNTAKFRAIVCQENISMASSNNPTLQFETLLKKDCIQILLIIEKNISRLNSAVLPQHFRGLIKRTSPDRVS